MLNQRLSLFKQWGQRLGRHSSQNSRSYYTDNIYPYPFNYINNVRYPSRPRYRETWEYAPWTPHYNKVATFLMRLFWTGWFYQMYTKPEAFTGHFPHQPDPSIWTDEQLGIPPDEYGSYKDWLATREAEGTEST